MPIQTTVSASKAVGVRAQTEQLRDLVADLHRVGVQDVRIDKAHRILYSTDASMYQIEPLGVVFPRSREEIAALITVCAQHQVPVLPRGAGTSLAGQTVGCALVVDCSRHLNQIVEVNAEERLARCQPGVVLDQLNGAASHHGLMLGPDPASGNRATVGGTVGNNGTGAHSILYGMIGDNVLATEAVLADGAVARFDADFWHRSQDGSRAADIRQALVQILDTYAGDIRRDFPRHWRRASGYNLDKLLETANPNLAHILAGSEGTLAFMTEITLALVPRPRTTALGVVHFADLVASAEATVDILELQPSAVELMDKQLMDLCRLQPEYARRLTFVDGDPACVLAVEFYVESEEEGRARLDTLRRHLSGRGHTGVIVPLLDPAAQANAWSVRKVGLGLLLSRRGDIKAQGFMEDVAVPPEHLAEYVRAVLRMFGEYGTEAAFYAHASAGCLHIRPFLNMKDARDVAVMDEMQSRLLELIQPYGGVLSGEHGDGIKLTRLNRRLFGERVTEAFAQVKLAFDPDNIFNPGKKVPEDVLSAVRTRNDHDLHPQDLEPRPQAARVQFVPGHASTKSKPLRYGPAYQTVQLAPFFDWSADGGFARAVEMCNGSGDCRKLSGVMCPSFQATREEEHSTRGRANLLRAALSGQLSREELTGDRLGEALDLCLGCKACKAECPSAVDMAKIKAEILAQRHAERGTPLDAWLFGHIHTLNRLAAPVAPLANAAANSLPGRLALRRITGLHPARSLPSFSSQPFTAWFQRHQQDKPDRDPSRARVVLFPDTFMTYNYPRIGIAAVRLLEAAGFQVILAPRVCCGRPMLSQGLIADARRNARRNVDLLHPLAKRELPILVCEPSCTAAFREEYFDLLPGDSRVAAVAQQVWPIDDWLAANLMGAATEFSLRALPRLVLFHGHCHQKACWGTSGSLAALALVPEQRVRVVDAGCCGMAGAFGYTADHYAISEAVARDRLVPVIDAYPEAVICADGASCRQQIEHFTGRPARHLVEVLADALPL